MLAGAIIGRFMPARQRGARLQKSPKPVCGCKHHHSFHDPETGECHGQVDIGGGVLSVSCTCRTYSGPVPLPEMYAPELGS